MALLALVTCLTAFGLYYYWDRYVHLGDQSPVERNVERLEAVIRADPQNPDNRTALAEYYLTAGMTQDALALSGEVLAHYPEHEGALLISGIAAARLDRLEAAVPPLEQFVARRRTGAMAQADLALEAAYYFLGESYLKLDQVEAAIAALEAALRISPTDADALYQLGLAYQARGQPELALEQYHRAVRLVPNFAEVYAGMAECYADLGWADHLAYARGMQAFTTQNYELAQSQLEQATAALPDFAPAFLGLGLTCEATGQLQAARLAMERALALEPGNFATQQALGRIRTNQTRQD
jgi:tetratricopeptide (TPR) repeat protein